MKSKLFKLTVAILTTGVWSQVHPDNGLLFEVSGPSFYVATTGNMVNLVLQNTDVIKAIQLTVVLNTTGVTLKEVRQSNRTLGQDWIVWYHSVSEERMNLLITNLGNDSFQAGEGVIAEIIFDLNDSVAEDFITLRLEQIKAADPRGKPVELLYGGDVTLPVIDDANIEFVLYQNYPNPFNPSTTISYYLRTPTYVTLKMYTAFGEEVAILFQGALPAGNYSSLWNGTNDTGVKLSSGSYFYRLRVGDFFETKRLLFLK